MRDPDAGRVDGIPRRDFWLLPLLSVLTVVAMFLVAEVSTRILWVDHDDGSCYIPDGSPEGPSRGIGFRPNCESRSKIAEGPWTVYRFNECGYRSETSCGPKPPGTLRIAIVGSSVAQALYVPSEQTYYSRLARELEQRCHVQIDVQNLGRPKSSPLFAYRHFDEALALKPDVVLYLLAPFDIEIQMDPAALAARNDPNPKLATPLAHEPLSTMRRLQMLIIDSRTALVAEHYLLQDRDTFLRLYLNYGDKADFLRTPLSEAWKTRFANLDLVLGDMASKAAAAHVPLVVVPVPSRAEAALLSSPVHAPGLDPAAFGRIIEGLALRHGAHYADLMSTFSQIRDSQNLFLIVDGHVTAEGQAVVGHQIAKALVGGAVPALAHCPIDSEVR